MKFLNLILYSPGVEYDQMREVLRGYLRTLSNVEYYFYYFDPSLDREYKIEGDLLVVRGFEGWIPNILSKTMRALELVKDYEYAYLIRSNISTIVNFKQVELVLLQTPVTYSGTLATLQWLDPSCGVVDQTFWGTVYALGTNIIFNKPTLLALFEPRHLVNYNLIDDIALGVLVRDSNLPYTKLDTLSRPGNSEYREDICFYRNHTDGNRYADVERMVRVISQL